MNTPDLLPLHTHRLVLRRFAESDAAAFLAYRNDPRIARYQGWEGCEPAEAAEFVQRHAVRAFGLPGEWLQIAIALKQSNQLIGDCAVRVHAPDARQATIGGTLSRPFHRQGFAVEALSCLLDCLFVGLNLHRVVADTDVENTAAWRLMEHLGFRREGHLKQSLWFKGRWADEYLYAMRREEWLVRRDSSAIKTT
jgi:RimJ/RimL family protein N-acetyltransferase